MLERSLTGGTTILAEVIALKTPYKTSQIILVIDAIIMFSSIFVYGDIEKALSQQILSQLGKHGTILQGVNLNQKDSRSFITSPIQC